MLIGKLFDENGDPLSTNQANKPGKHYRYYISKRLKETTVGMPKHGWRVPAQQLEDLVARIAQEALSNQSVIAETLNNAAVAPHLIPGALQATNDAAPQIVMESRREVLFAEWVQRVAAVKYGISRIERTKCPLMR